jgi:hypothetical protein
MCPLTVVVLLSKLGSVCGCYDGVVMAGFYDWLVCVGVDTGHIAMHAGAQHAQSQLFAERLDNGNTRRVSGVLPAGQARWARRVDGRRETA